MAEKYPPYSRLTGLRPAEVEIILKSLRSYEGEVDDLDTLELIEGIRNKIRENLDSGGRVYGM